MAAPTSSAESSRTPLPRESRPHRAEYHAALDQAFGAEDEAFLDSLVPPGHASTPGYTDPLYPVTGRGTGSSLARA